MKEEEVKRRDIEELIANIRLKIDPESGQYLAESITEIYLSGDFGCAMLEGNEMGKFKAMRFVRRHEDRLVLLGFGGEGKEMYRLSDAISSEAKRLFRSNRKIPGRLESLALRTLKEERLHTVAGMSIREGSTTKNRLFSVYFPRLFMNLDPSLSPSQKEPFGLAVAVHFLKRVPVK